MADHMFAYCPQCERVVVWSRMATEDEAKDARKEAAKAVKRGLNVVYVDDDEFDSYRERLGRCICGSTS